MELSNYSEHNVVKAYVCRNKNNEIRNQSTSGGVFYLLAEYVIRHLHGVVIGVKFNKDFEAEYCCVESMDKLLPLLGSKYMQANPKGILKTAKQIVQQERYVLFIGTPCQVEGLLAYVGMNTPFLITIDFICHGVASPMIWQEYLNVYQKKVKLQQIFFKDKITGWKNWHTKFVYKNKVIYQRSYMNDFMTNYLGGMYSRKACSNCYFKGLSRKSDFTISDCWGIGEKSNLNDDMGLSAILIHSERGKELFESISSGLLFEEYDPYELMKDNYTTFISVKENPDRSHWFEVLHREGIKSANRKFGRLKYKKILSYKIKDWFYRKKNRKEL